MAVALALGGCDTSDTFAVRNATMAALETRVQVVGRFTWYDCDDAPDPRSFEGSVTIEIAPGMRVCFEGPVSGDSYDARDLLLHLTVRRIDAATTCIDAAGEALRDEFMNEGHHRTLRVDETSCPGP